MSDKIVSFSRLGSYGRLGNQLFQIASTVGIADESKAVQLFPNWSYEKYFALKLPKGPMQDKRVVEKSFEYHDWNITDSCDLLGYMQSEKYFQTASKEIFRFDNDFVRQVKSKTSSDLFSKETICIQVRRGDYVGNPNYYQIPIEFYIDSLVEHFPNWKDFNFVVISDDIDYCRIHFDGLPNVFFSTMSDIEDLCLASMCTHFIIANSSFGWWCAWLGEKKGSKIVHSGRLHAGELLKRTNEKDYWPERWIANKKESYKIDLKDTTFTIPVYHDHPDRKKNLDLSLCMVQKSFDTNVIIGEQGSMKFGYTEQWAKYHLFSEMKMFHRTKMLNDMAIMSETPIIVNWDCDVIIPPLQVYLAVAAIRNGADMVFPYDGRFARMGRMAWFDKIEKSLDIGVVGKAELKGKFGNPLPVSSVGGAVLFNKDAFIDGGMENEHMISFGPEDCERNDRFKALGFRVERTGGCLYHMDHFIGIDSSSQNPYFKANHAEIEKIRAMSPDELRQYVDTWLWRHQYTAAYYERISEGSRRSARHVFEALNKIGIIPDSVADIGCGAGAWNVLNALYIGYDHKIPKKATELFDYMDVDLCVVPYKEVNGKVDIVLCLEVAEHLEASVASHLVSLLCKFSNKVLFSAAIPNQGGTGHINEQWQTYWEKLFNENGFGAAKVQPDIRNNPEIELWYRQNIVLYEKGVKGKVENFVLPEYYEQIVLGLKNQIKG